MTIVHEAPKMKRSEKMSLTVSYDATNRTASQTSDILIIPAASSADYNRIARMPPEDAVKSKLGTLKTQDIKNAMLGQSRLNYWDGSSTAMSQSAAKGLGELAFDPRTLGISVDLSATIPITFYLGYENCRAAKFVGSELINGVKTAHVTVDTAIGTHLDFWIEDAPGFRVHRHSWASGKLPLVRTCDSTFAQDSPSAIFPSTVTIRSYRKKTPESAVSTTITVDRIEFGPQSPPPGSVASLNLPVGTAVVDDKSGSTLGYWDGKELAKEMPRRLPDPAKSRNSSGFVFIYVGVGAVLLAIGGAVNWYNNRKRPK